MEINTAYTALDTAVNCVRKGEKKRLCSQAKLS